MVTSILLMNEKYDYDNVTLYNIYKFLNHDDDDDDRIYIVKDVSSHT